ncbi:MAG: hypothetical protein IKT41_04815 [Clostridia bacterium]|nr:hypothetical protein [Clostridia bacterium]
MNIKNSNKKTTIVFYSNATELQKEVNLDTSTISFRSIGHNKPFPVYFDGKFGFLKDSTYTSKSVLDKYEYIICQLGKMLGIKMAETYKVYFDNNFAGIISESVLDNNTEKMFLAIDIDTLIQNPDKDLIAYINYIKQLYTTNNQVFHRTNGDTWNIPTIDKDEDINTVIELFPNLIKRLESNPIKQNEIIQDYYNMIMLDIITNNVDRNSNNYGLILDKDNHFRFAGLFDNSTTYIPGLPSTKRRINGFMIDRDKLLTVLFKKHYHDIENITKSCSENKSELIDYIRKLCNQNLEHDEANTFLMPITQNLLTICNYQKTKEKGQVYKRYNREKESNR